LDRNVRIGSGVKLCNNAGVKEGAAGALPKGVVIRDGIIVVRRDAIVPDGTVV
jgi:hypothetical protein